MKKRSIVGKDYHTEERVVGHYNAGDRMKRWGKSGAFWGGIWGLLLGSAFFAIPGIGPVLVAGPLAAWMVGALEGAVVVGGLSAIGAGLYSLGIPKDSVVQYESAIRPDKFLLLAHGTVEEVEKAGEIMRTARPVEVAVHGVQHREAVGAGAASQESNMSGSWNKEIAAWKGEGSSGAWPVPALPRLWAGSGESDTRGSAECAFHGLSNAYDRGGGLRDC